MTGGVRLSTFDPAYAQAFAALNYEWIETFFAVEAADRAALDDPHAYAIASGGEIFFVLEDEQPVGTVAMVPFKADSALPVYELAKMAVRPACQGKGYGRLLMQACIEFARRQGAGEIVLITNDVLQPALGLYTAAGFEPMPVNSDTRYSRGNLEMRLRL